MEHTFICTKDAGIVQTKQGKLRGFFHDDVFNFWGVRYARARRFHMPVPPESWDGVRTAMAYGHVSPLLEDPIPDFELTVPHRFWPEGEDCLNLNIATPTLDPEAKKPVMVWFHGGGFSDGSAIAHIAFEGDNMARNHDVVMVCVNHRLNPCMEKNIRTPAMRALQILSQRFNGSRKIFRALVATRIM